MTKRGPKRGASKDLDAGAKKAKTDTSAKKKSSAAKGRKKEKQTSSTEDLPSQRPAPLGQRKDAIGNIDKTGGSEKEKATSKGMYHCC
jgi:hypothetical protein